MRTQLISIHTTRYSAAFRRILTEYSAGIIAEIDGRVYPATNFPHLIEHWCTNERACAPESSCSGAVMYSFSGSTIIPTNCGPQKQSWDLWSSLPRSKSYGSGVIGSLHHPQLAVGNLSGGYGGVRAATLDADVLCSSH